MGKAKDNFISEHGQAEWNKVSEYYKGNKTAENTAAATKYSNIQKRKASNDFTIYGILENGKIIYVGSTGLKMEVRFNAHKTKARTLKHARPLHCHMNEASTNHDLFPEFDICTLETAKDQRTADIVEKALIKKYNTHIDGFNKYIGGGMKGKQKSIRPKSDGNYETR